MSKVTRSELVLAEDFVMAGLAGCGDKVCVLWGRKGDRLVVRTSQSYRRSLPMLVRDAQAGYGTTIEFGDMDDALALADYLYALAGYEVTRE